MELDELKNVWASVEARLKKQEILNENVIREMIYKKTNKSLKQLFWSDSIGIPVLLFVIPVMVYAYGRYGGKHIFWDAIVIFGGVFCIAYLPFLIYRIYGLMKIDLSGNLKNNLNYINRYSIYIKREIIVMSFLSPASFILVCLMFIELKAGVVQWTFLICFSILVLFCSYWSYSKLYKKNIQSIKKSLEQLEETKEE